MTVQAKDFFVSGSGGTIQYVDSADQLLMEVAIPPGRVAARPYVEMCPPGAVLQTADGIALFSPFPACNAINYGDDGLKSAANPDFRPSSSDTFQREMRAHMSRVMAQNNALAAKVNSLQRIEQIPQAPKQEAQPPAEKPKDDPVVE